MTILKVVFFCTDEYGEGDMYLEADDTLIAVVSSNDADWRHEYFNPIMKRVGVDVVSDQFQNNEEKYTKLLKEFFGD